MLTSVVIKRILRRSAALKKKTKIDPLKTLGNKKSLTLKVHQSSTKAIHRVLPISTVEPQVFLLGCSLHEPDARFALPLGNGFHCGSHSSIHVSYRVEIYVSSLWYFPLTAC